MLKTTIQTNADLEAKRLRRRKNILKYYRIEDIPQYFREALGIKLYTPMKEAISKDYTFSKEVVNFDDDYEPVIIDEIKPRTYGPRTLKNIRDNKIILLSRLWYETKDILNIINDLAKSRFWWVLKNIRQINRIKYNYWKYSKPLVFETEKEKELFYNHINRQQDLINELNNIEYLWDDYKSVREKFNVVKNIDRFIKQQYWCKSKKIRLGNNEDSDCDEKEVI